MVVCVERIYDNRISSRVAPQEFYPVPALSGQDFCFFTEDIEMYIFGDSPIDRQKNIIWKEKQF